MKLAKSSIPYLGTVMPFKGIRVYLRPAMGMPGSSEYLQELTARVFGDFMLEGFVVLIADDIFIGADSISELLINWFRVLLRLQECNLTLSATKTIVCPKTMVILGWIWTAGTFVPSKHKISTLATVSPPKTCSTMRSFIRSFKALSRCFPKYASLMSPLEDATKGLDGRNLINWSTELQSHFETAQLALKSPKTLTIPKPSDQLVMTVDASPANKGLGTTLFIQQHNKRLVAEFYSFKLKDHQVGWFACELEALAIAAGVNHFVPYARESEHAMQILTDSKPCVQAFKRLCEGQLSASSRVSTFLSTLSSHRVTVAHIPGVANSTSDYSSRHPQECDNKTYVRSASLLKKQLHRSFALFPWRMFCLVMHRCPSSIRLHGVLLNITVQIFEERSLIFQMGHVHRIKLVIFATFVAI